ncbi:MAG: thioesterase [Cytophagales bacterium]|nr:thioesterase [Cytophagales bacterium]
MNNVQLFCLPFAGGNKYSYRHFERLAPRGLSVIPLELAGRGSRSHEPLATSLAVLTDDVFGQIRHKLNQPYAIYGHSMGALLGYLLTRKIIEEKCNQPLHLFCTGAGGPSRPLDEPPRYALPKLQFIDKIREMGGSPDEVLNNEVLMNFFEPILRADFEAVDTYTYRETEPFDVPVSVITGLNERITREEAMLWQQETTRKLYVKHLPGNHFFIFDHQSEILEIITNKLNQKLNTYENC